MRSMAFTPLARGVYLCHLPDLVPKGYQNGTGRGALSSPGLRPRLFGNSVGDFAASLPRPTSLIEEFFWEIKGFPKKIATMRSAFKGSKNSDRDVKRKE